MTKKGQDVAFNKLLKIRKFYSASKVNPMNYLEKIGQKGTLVTEKLHKLLDKAMSSTTNTVKNKSKAKVTVC